MGANSHGAEVRIGVVHGFLVYMALILDSNNNFHGVVVDAVNGKALTSSQMSLAGFRGYNASDSIEFKTIVGEMS